jgi:hypothetical protein
VLCPSTKLVFKSHSKSEKRKIKTIKNNLKNIDKSLSSQLY